MVSMVRALAERAAPLLSPTEKGADVWPFSFSNFTESGQVVTRDVAMTLGTVKRCLMLIGTIAQLPTHVYERTEGSRIPIERPAERALWDRPNPEMTKVSFYETLFTHLPLGNAFLYAVGDGSRDIAPAELWPIEPSRVRVGRDNDGRKVYRIDDATQHIVQRDWRDGGNIVHIMGPSDNGLVGRDALADMANTIGRAVSANRTAGRFFKKGQAIQGYLVSAQPLTPDESREIGTYWDENYSGSENAFKTPVLSRGTEWKQVTLSPEQLQMLESRQFETGEIADHFGIPRQMVGAQVSGGMNYSNIEDWRIDLLTFTLGQYIARVEQTITDQLLRPQNHIFKFDQKGFLRGNSAQRSQYIEKMFNLVDEDGKRALTIDEIRALEELRPWADVQGV